MNLLLQSRFDLQDETMEEFGYSSTGEPLYQFCVTEPLDEQEVDAQLEYNRIRHFDRRIGRWLLADPLGYEG